jgi:hypothetical protein
MPRTGRLRVPKELDTREITQMKGDRTLDKQLKIDSDRVSMHHDL